MKRHFLCLFLLCAAPALAQPAPMVVAGHPLAAQAGLAVLREGGTAIDAAITVQAVLTVVEPQASGIGGGAFLLHWDGRAVTAWDGRETAPAAATEDLFLRDGRPMPFRQAVVGGRSVGVPGVMRMLEAAHREHGALPWARLFAPAIRLAEEGFPVSPYLARVLVTTAPGLRQDPAAAALFLTAEGGPLPAGATLRNPALAATLRALAAQGADALHTGPIAEEILRVVRGHANPGQMTAEDLAGYAPRRAQAICLPYRAFTLCGPPPPSGAAVVLQIMGLLAHFDLPSLPPDSADAAMLIGEAGRLAFADRNMFMADPAFATVPVAGLLDPAYLTARAQQISLDRAIATIAPGNPRHGGPPLASQPPQPEGGTAQVSILDAQGRAVSMTTTIEGLMGAHVMAGGFLLNNQLTDFSFLPARDGRPIANRVAGGKRPRSSMSPILAFRDGRLVAVTGSPGGARIIGYVAQSLVALLDWDMSAEATVALPHVGPLNAVVELEAETPAAALQPVLAARGLEVSVRAMSSGLHVIRLRPGQPPQGGADPRREGVVAGE
jgi:gamma-glutamyltranspeptidase / glutathione hydrolase